MTYRVFATQYAPRPAGSVEVALPDKCAKFAALQNRAVLAQFGCPAEYRLDLDYRVVVRRANGQSAALPVKEAGPWNIDDNYWGGGPGSPRPRRLFGDLPRGLPEAQAAFYQGYNVVSNCKDLEGNPTGRTAGADQSGRCVLNPAGLDLSFAAASQLGLSRGQNEWVDVTFLWETTDGSAVLHPALTQSPRVGAINSCGGGYVKGGALSGVFREQLGCGDARVLTLGGNRVGVINSCGAAHVKQGSLANPFTLMLNCGDARAITVSSERVAVINSCGGAYVKEGPLSSPFRQQLSCGDARAVSLGESRLGVINGCGAAYVKEGSLAGPLRRQLGCGDAQAVVVTGDRVGVVNSCGAFYVKQGPLNGPFQQQTGCGDTRAIALYGTRVAVINGCGSLYVKEGTLTGPFRQQTGCGDAVVTALDGDRVGVINGCGAAYVKEGSLDGGFNLQLPCGQARALSFSSF